MKNTQKYIDLVSNVVEDSLLGYGFPIDIETGQYKQQSIKLMEFFLRKQLQDILPAANFDIAIKSDGQCTINLCVKMCVDNKCSQLEFIGR